MPGIATLTDLQGCLDAGATTVRVAVHCTEADCGQQPVDAGPRSAASTVVTFLMMSHMLPPEKLADQARRCSTPTAADVVYVVDSAGACRGADRRPGLRALGEIGHAPTVGFHAHDNLGLGVGNRRSPPAPGSPMSTARCAGSAPAPATRRSRRSSASATSCWRTGIDFLQIVDASEDVIKPAMPEARQLDRMTLMMGYAGVYSSFLKHAGNAAERYGVSGAEILLEAGRRNVIGGQEDKLIDIALMLKAEQDKETANA